MTPCDNLIDQMPEIAAGRATWSRDDALHLAHCDDCTAHWTLVTTAHRLGREVSVDTHQLAAAVLDRLRAPRESPRPAWTRLGLGLAAAAAVALAFTSSRSTLPAARDLVPVASDAAPLMFPELAPLSAPQLENILASVADGADLLVDPGAALPRLGDLTDEQLEELILSVEGE